MLAFFISGAQLANLFCWLKNTFIATGTRGFLGPSVSAALTDSEFSPVRTSARSVTNFWGMNAAETVPSRRMVGLSDSGRCFASFGVVAGALTAPRNLAGACGLRGLNHDSGKDVLHSPHAETVRRRAARQFLVWGGKC